MPRLARAQSTAELIAGAIRPPFSGKHPVERFLSHVEKGPGCWRWLKSHSPQGYARFGIAKGIIVHAHRFSYEHFRGPVPPNRYLDHLCRNRGCVNPWHLEIVDNRTNILRGTGFSARNARITHCSKGHVFDKIVGTHRHCSKCQNAHRRRQFNSPKWKARGATGRGIAQVHPCPKCHRPAGQKCVTISGRELNYAELHSDRFAVGGQAFA